MFCRPLLPVADRHRHRAVFLEDVEPGIAVVAHALSEGHPHQVPPVLVRAVVVQEHAGVLQLERQADPVEDIAGDVARLVVVLVAGPEGLAVHDRPLLHAVEAVLDEVVALPALDPGGLAGLEARNRHIARPGALQPSARGVPDLGGEGIGSAAQLPVRLHAPERLDPGVDEGLGGLLARRPGGWVGRAGVRRRRRCRPRRRKQYGRRERQSPLQFRHRRATSFPGVPQRVRGGLARTAGPGQCTSVRAPPWRSAGFLSTSVNMICNRAPSRACRPGPDPEP